MMHADKHWDTVRRAAEAAGVPEKEAGDGPMRRLHVEMYDVAKTAAECRAVRDRALKEVTRQAALPKPLTFEERLAALEAKQR